MSSIVTKPALNINVAGLSLSSPILNASGCFNPTLFNQIYPLQQCLGAIVSKTVTATPRTGNHQQRTVELAGIGMLNSIGLQNAGLDHFLEKDAPEFATMGTPVIMSMAAASIEEFATMTQKMTNHTSNQHISAIELNMSCPNVAKGGVDFGHSPKIVNNAVKQTLENTNKPVFVKLTPNITSTLPIAEAAINAGASGITAINTLLGTSINLKTKKPYLPRVSGGYSGPGIKPVALHHVWQLHKNFPETPIIGVGGIETAEDVLEFILAGASLVQVGTSCFRNPLVFKELHHILQQYLVDHQIEDLKQLIGYAHQ